ncbi:MAG: class I SAM-dependent RNA methyltransferase [Anaerolineae bacterium]|nr:class I SAM-dependent RNA methyltransferase [Gemmatimonadaceae bacterium]
MKTGGRSRRPTSGFIPQAPAKALAKPKKPVKSAPLSLFAVTAPGLERLAVAELLELGIAAREVEGGAAFSGTLHDVGRANLWLRTASRVIARIGEFHARSFAELERHAKQQPWDRFLVRGADVRLRVTCKKSRLYHSDAVAERVAAAIDARLGSVGALTVDRSEDDEVSQEQTLIVVRVFRDVVTISADTSGDLLHMRGYRLATVKAPLRETLAAALLTSSGWTSELPLLDPMCGAGTIPIEGSLIARRIAPGLLQGGSTRRFAFFNWPEFDAAKWDEIVADARGAVLPSAASPILGSDRDAGAIAAAMANAERAGVAADVEFSERALSAIEPPVSPGWLITNPPYGVRVGERDRLRNLYAQLGNVARLKLQGWSLAMLSADETLDRQVGVPLETVLATRNGGIAVRVLRGSF